MNKENKEIERIGSQEEPVTQEELKQLDKFFSKRKKQRAKRRLPKRTPSKTATTS